MRHFTRIVMAAMACGSALAAAQAARAQSIITAAPAPPLRSTIDDAPPAPRRPRPTADTAGPGSELDSSGSATRRSDRVVPGVRSSKVKGRTALETFPNRAVKEKPHPFPSMAGDKPPATTGSTGAPDASPRSNATVQTPAPGLAGPPALATRRRRDTADPWEPVGLRLGNMNVFIAGESGVGFDDNVDRTQTGKRSSVLFREGGELKLRSDWSNHELTADIRGGYSWYKRAPDADRPDGDARVRLRLDVTRDTQVEVEGHGILDSQRPGSPNLTADVLGRPLSYSYGGSTAVTERFNRLVLSLRGTLDRTSFDDAFSGAGTRFDQATRNYNTAGVVARAGYEVQPGWTPFVEAQADHRQYDRAVDVDGFRRSSDGVTAKVGSTFEVTRLVTAEVSGGYGQRSYEDKRLKDLRGPLLDGAITWAATPLTTVTLRGGTTFDETTLIGSSGTITRRVALDLNHNLLRNLAVGGTLAYLTADYQGIKREDDGWAVSANATYRFTRSLSVRAAWSHERSTSSDKTQNYDANTYLLSTRFDL